jgi:ribulose-5-phosphate 4-epimerase/fuculose-1-phosphate aldolase
LTDTFDGSGMPDLSDNPSISALSALLEHDSDTDSRILIAEACRILANGGLAEDILGHVSTRSADGSGVLIRCRGPLERGLLFTELDDVHLLPAGPGHELPGGYQPPNEYPIHREIYEARPDVQAIVHAHPPAVVAADLAGLELRPIVGAFNIPAMRMANQGIPVYPRSVLINKTSLAQDLAAALGDSDVCILRGHGIVATGTSVQQAMVRALNLEALARMTLLAHGSGTTPPEVSGEDLNEMPDLGTTFNDSYVWRHHVSRLEMDHLGVRATPNA